MADKEFAEITDSGEISGTDLLVILQGGNSRKLDFDKALRWFQGSQINDQTGTSYTVVLTDAGGTVRMNNASANTVTIPPNSTTILKIGTRIRVTEIGAGTTTIVEGAGVTINTSSDLILGTQWMSGVLIKVDTDEWDLHKTGGGSAGDLDSLSDVDLTTITKRKNDRIVFDGANWVQVGSSIVRLSSKAEIHTNNETRIMAWTEDEDTDNYFGGGTVSDEHIEIPFTGRYRLKVKVSYTSVNHDRWIAQIICRLNRTGTTFDNDFPHFRYDHTYDVGNSIFNSVYESYAIIDLTVNDEIDILVYQFSSSGNRTFVSASSYLNLEYMGPTP